MNPAFRFNNFTSSRHIVRLVGEQIIIEIKIGRQRSIKGKANGHMKLNGQANSHEEESRS